ncbi:MAG: acetyltransferase [Leptolyngbya sp. DLM2.Bin15]|nr:MAG: acetyltransferase [Leptolyngbya sp. DLM2.Bin15]
MLLQEKRTGKLVEVIDFESLINPMRSEITIRLQAGEEKQDPEAKQKTNFVFPSGEDLPRCWLDGDYKNH